MDLKRKIIRCLSRMTCDKPELNPCIVKIKKRLDEACAALNDDRKK